MDNVTGLDGIYPVIERGKSGNCRIFTKMFVALLPTGKVLDERPLEDEYESQLGFILQCREYKVWK